MASDDIWDLYAKSVKKLRKVKGAGTARDVRVPLPLAGGVRGGLAKKCSFTNSNTAHVFTSPPPAPPASGRRAQTAPTPHTTLDRRVEKNIRQGEIALQARIDLHGMTQPEAHNALAHFITAQVKAGRRNLLIITGKGKGKEGVLRTNLPHWLHSFPEAAQILALRPAAPKHGGDGAFYVVLRKKMDAGERG